MIIPLFVASLGYSSDNTLAIGDMGNTLLGVT